MLRFLLSFFFFAIAGIGWTGDLSGSDRKVLDLAVLSGGGLVTNDHGRDTLVWSAGLHIGKIMRGNRDQKFLELAGEINPAFVVFQSSTVYGLEVVPFLLKWTYGSGGRVRPYTEVGGGMLFSQSHVPENTSKFNFTPQVRFGLEFPLRNSRSLLVAFKYLHISNATLAERNRGYNTVQVQFGYQWFK